MGEEGWKTGLPRSSSMTGTRTSCGCRPAAPPARLLDGGPYDTECERMRLAESRPYGSGSVWLLRVDDGDECEYDLGRPSVSSSASGVL